MSEDTSVMYAPWEPFKIPGDRLGRWSVIGFSMGRGKPAIAERIRTEKHARLIAAAPDLLEALKFIIEQMDLPENSAHTIGAYLHGQGVALARAAIAKATQP